MPDLNYVTKKKRPRAKGRAQSFREKEEESEGTVTTAQKKKKAPQEEPWTELYQLQQQHDRTKAQVAHLEQEIQQLRAIIRTASAVLKKGE